MSASAPSASTSSPPQKRQRVAVDDSDDEDIGPQDETVDEKEKRRQARVLRNRASAQNSRNRRKNHMIELEALVVKLQEENAALRSSSSSPSTSTTTPAPVEAPVDLLKAENQALRQRVALLESLVHQVLASSNPLAPSNQVNYGLPPTAFSPPAGNTVCAPSAPVDEPMEMDYSFLLSASEPALVSVDDNAPPVAPAEQTVSDDVWNALLHPALAPAAPTLAQPPVPSLDFTRHPAAGDLGNQGSESAALGDAVIIEAEQDILHGRQSEAVKTEDWSEDTSEAGEVLKAFEFDFGQLGGVELSSADDVGLGLGLWTMDLEGQRAVEA